MDISNKVLQNWGKTTDNQTLTLPSAYTNTIYHITVGQQSQLNNYEPIVVYNKTKTNFAIKCNNTSFHITVSYIGIGY